MISIEERSLNNLIATEYKDVPFEHKTDFMKGFGPQFDFVLRIYTNALRTRKSDPLSDCDLHTLAKSG